MKSIVRGTIRWQIRWLSVLVPVLLSLTVTAQPNGDVLSTAVAVRGLTVEQAQQRQRSASARDSDFF